MKAIVFASIGLALGGCSSGGSVNPTCSNLIGEVTDLAKEKNNVEIIEANNIKTIFEAGSTLKCSATAVTDRGDAYVEYGVESSSQGKQLLTASFR